MIEAWRNNHILAKLQIDFPSQKLLHAWREWGEREKKRRRKKKEKKKEKKDEEEEEEKKEVLFKPGMLMQSHDFF